MIPHCVILLLSCIYRSKLTAVFSYIDPVTAIIISAAFLGERLDAVQIVGTVLILAATLFNELAPMIRERLKKG